MIELNWDDFYNVVPELRGETMKLGTMRIPMDEVIHFGGQIGSVPTRDLMLSHSMHPAAWHPAPQLALLTFIATRRVYALSSYFPLTKILDKAKLKDFYRLAGEIIRKPQFRVALVYWNKGGQRGIISGENAWKGETAFNTTPGLVVDWASSYNAEIAFFIACHIAEMFFYQRPILNRLLKTSFEIRIATSQEAFEQDGGVAGGCFNAEKRTIQLVLSRLFEGFNGKTPGVAPFLHEFGHLLDHFDVKERRLTHSHGTLPGMRPGEGKLYNPPAQNRFLKGKQLEWQRYMHLHDNGYHEDDAMPIGHPYVFQNNGEFIAGYLEMFFRNPHYFAALNPALYDSFQLTFGYDPSKAWVEDFPYYVEQNQKFYREHRPPKPGISV